MSLSRGVLPPRREEEMFIGWAPAPRADRRFLIMALPLGLAGAGGLAAVIARSLSDPGPGSWDPRAIHVVEGALVRQPYPMIRTPDAAAPGGMRTTLVVAQGKCTSALKLGAGEGRLVAARGGLVERRGRRMLEVPFDLDKWLDEKAQEAPQTLVAPVVEHFGTVRLSGEVMDSKCFFGVMRPARGQTHKACAALCIRGGIPPSFWARDATGRESVLLMTAADGGPVGDDILPLVGEPVVADGEIVRVGDLVQFRADARAYRRL